MNERIVLPGTALSVSRLCLGGNRLGAALDRDSSFALLDAFVAAGGAFVDTAHVYADWLPDVERSCSEKTIGRWRSARGVGDAVVVATKIGHPALAAPTASRLDRANLRRDVAESLDNLQMDRLDLVYLHRDDPRLDPADILGPLEELRAEGLIRHYGASNWTAARLRVARERARAEGWQGFVANQAEWSLAARNPGSRPADLTAMDAATIDWHTAGGQAAVPYSSQAQGYFDKLAAGAVDPATARIYDNAANRARGERLARLGARHGLTPTQAMLALFRFAPFPVIPVVGCRTPEQLASSFRGAQAALEPARAQRLLDDLGLRNASTAAEAE